MRHRGRRAIAMLETAMWIPVMVLLLFGIVELGRVSYTYYALHKALYTIAKLVSAQQGVNFCDDADTTVTTAKEYALRGAPEGEGESIFPSLTAEQIAVRVERVSTEGDLEECECSETGCDISSGGRSPDFVVVSIPDGYAIRLVFPGMNLDPIPLRPQVRIPFGGT